MIRTRVVPAAARTLAALVILATAVRAEPAPVLVALAPASDARQALAIGPHGEVYAPDGRGAWTRTQRFATATTLDRVARVGDAVVAHGEGVIYKLAPNGWSALRLAQSGKAVLADGVPSVGAVGRQLYSLHELARGEPAKLGTLPGPVVALGAGASIIAVTDRGAFRIAKGSKPTKLAKAPVGVRRLVGDRWALVDGAAVELRSGKRVAWPAGATIEVAALGPDDDLVAIARTAGAVELLRVRGATIARTPIAATPGVHAIGVVVDRQDRVIVGFADGTLLTRDGAAWSTRAVAEALPAARPGPGPATSR